jgi:hypothetical protein
LLHAALTSTHEAPLFCAAARTPLEQLVASPGGGMHATAWSPASRAEEASTFRPQQPPAGRGAASARLVAAAAEASALAARLRARAGAADAPSLPCSPAALSAAEQQQQQQHVQTPAPLPSPPSASVSVADALQLRASLEASARRVRELEAAQREAASREDALTAALRHAHAEAHAAAAARAQPFAAAGPLDAAAFMSAASLLRVAVAEARGALDFLAAECEGARAHACVCALLSRRSCSHHTALHPRYLLQQLRRCLLWARACLRRWRAAWTQRTRWLLQRWRRRRRDPVCALSGLRCTDTPK